MSSEYQFVPSVSVGRIFLNETNPRFEPVQSEAEAIAELCKNEEVLALAKDIAQQDSLNPMERLALVPARAGSEGGDRASYVVVEGNRRICALKLLLDPELAPSRQRAKFRALSDDWTPISTVSAVVFKTVEDVDLWLARMHAGPQNGIGRKSWNPDQKARHFKEKKNQLALQILDYAEENGMISKEDRKGKLTTAQRFVSKEAFKEHFGIDDSNPEVLQRNRPKEDFDKLLKRFVADLCENKVVTSRKNKSDIATYARSVVGDEDVTTTRVEAEPLAEQASKPPTRKRKVKPKAPKPAAALTHELEIKEGLDRLGNYKLMTLYYSVTTVELQHHTPLVAVGLWSFVETLTACMGRNSNTDFNAFLSNDRLGKMGLGDKRALAPIREALKRVQNFGNHTKHHSTAATFDGQQLNNDLETLRELILACIGEAISSKK